jgi:hypothetical protein
MPNENGPGYWVYVKNPYLSAWCKHWSLPSSGSTISSVLITVEGLIAFLSRISSVHHDSLTNHVSSLLESTIDPFNSCNVKMTILILLFWTRRCLLWYWSLFTEAAQNERSYIPEMPEMKLPAFCQDEKHDIRLITHRLIESNVDSWCPCLGRDSTALRGRICRDRLRPLSQLVPQTRFRV